MNDQPRQPWYKNGIALIAMGLTFNLIVLGLEVWLLLSGFNNGLPEAVTTVAFSAGSSVIGYGGACINARTGTGT